jgi:uncharacterized protein (DUF1684 family)
MAAAPNNQHAPEVPTYPAGRLALADWRRRIAELYSQVREAEDGEAAWRAWRAQRDALFHSHPSSPLETERRAGFRGLSYFPYDSAARFLVELEAVESVAEQAIDLREEGRITLHAFQRTRGLEPVLGGELNVYWISGYGGGIFLPFADGSSGEETFSGGRYLLDGIKGADLGMKQGRLLLDFNFAYNPSCAYSPRWLCPLCPPENRLPRAVRAGERAPQL